MAAAPIQIVLAVPESLLRLGLREGLAHTAAINIAAESSNESEALQLVQAHTPDVVVLSNRTADNLFDFCGQLHEQCFSLLLVADANKEVVLAAARAGIRGLLCIDSLPDEIEHVIREVARGRLGFSNNALAFIAEDYAISARSSGSKDPVQTARPVFTGKEKLSKREEQVLAAVAAGNTSRQIAGQLGISARTVEAHRARVSDKLGIRTIAGLTRFALKMGLLDGQSQ